MKTGELIGIMAKERGISLRQLAIDAGIPYNTLYAIVKRKSTRIEPGTLRRLAAALGVSVAHLQGWDEAISKLEAAGMSADDVAEELNIPIKTVMDIMNAQGVYSPEMAEKIILVASLLAKNAEEKDQAALDVMRLFNTDDYHIEKAAKVAVFYSERIHKNKGYSFSLVEEDLISHFSKLNNEGKQKAVERVEELTEIPKYQRTDTPENK